MSKINKLFDDKHIVIKVQQKLPRLFQLAENENSRYGHLGMEIGSARERIIIALLIHEFGKENVKTNVAVTEKETDVIVFNKPISIKTFTNKKVVGVKLIWTVDAQKALDFINNYKSKSDMLFIHINWNGDGGVYSISKKAQNEILKKYGKNYYFKLPKQGTNPRGVEITKQAIIKLLNHNTTKAIKIRWLRIQNQKIHLIKGELSYDQMIYINKNNLFFAVAVYDHF